MRRSRRSAKVLTPDSSDDEEPLSNFTNNKAREKPSNGDSSSSESDIENYLQSADKIDLDSPFFNLQKEPQFDKIEKEILGNVKQLSDSESEAEKEEDVSPPQPSPTKLNFGQLHEYTKKIEEAKRHVEEYNRRKQERDKELDIQNLLAAGESKDKEKQPEVSLHSSEFESCSDSEKEGWEEVKEETNKETEDAAERNLEITVEMPGAVKKKKGDDLMLAIKRRINRMRKENQVLIHKVHLLCWIAHGNYVNSKIDSQNVLATALSLLPSQQCYPPNRTDLKYLEQIVKWFRNAVTIADKPVFENDLEKALEAQIAKKEALNKKMLVYIFVAVLRSLGVQCRLVFSFQVEPLRPPSSELHSLSTKNKNQPGPSKEKVTKQTKKREETEDENEGKNPTRKSIAKERAGETKKSSAKSETKENTKKNFVKCETEEKVGKTKKTVNSEAKEKGESTRKSSVRSAAKENLENTKKTSVKSEAKEKLENTKESSEAKEKVKSTRKSSVRSAAKANTRKSTVNSVKKMDGEAEKNQVESKKTSKTRSKSVGGKPDLSKLKPETTRNRTSSATSSKEKKSQEAKEEETRKFRTRKEKTVPQLDGANDSDDSKPNLRKLRSSQLLKAKKVTKYQDASGSEDDFSSSTDKKTESPKPNANNNRKSKKSIDVRNDIINIMKKTIKEKKDLDKARMVRKRKGGNDESEDSDYVPEVAVKKRRESEDDFSPKVKVKRRVQVKGEEEVKKKKFGNDVWAEVFLESEEKWISVDVIKGQVHCVSELFNRATHPVSYVVAWNNNNSIKDITKRYCVNFNTVTRKLRIDSKWWEDTLKPFIGVKNVRDKEEDEELERQQLEKPLPTTISEYKNHPLYVLKRHLLKFEALYPPDPPTLGFVRNEPVYSRQCVHTLHSREIWLKHAKVVKPGEQPYKIVKARPKWDKLSNKVITDQLLEVFGPWQVQDYEPPTAENGIVPRSAYGTVELFKPCMLPKKTVHLKLPGLNKVAKKLNIDCASALVGFDFHGGWNHPVYDGYVVCEEFADQLVAAWDMEQEELERKEQEKIDKRVYGNWRKLIRGLLIRERLKAKYDFGESSSGGGKGKKKAKGPPKFPTKKRRVESSSDSE